MLIGVYSGDSLEDAENSMRELAALAETAGAVVLDGLLQRRPHPDPSTYLGSGKVQELADVVRRPGADTVVADTELAPSQRRALEDAVKVKVIDRTAVILDIFSQHAKSREGKAQVELAQLEYLLPRLRGWGESMSRQAGGQVGGAGTGMGSRGPGETKIELDRRRIHTRMALLRKQIKGFAPAREAKRANRDRFEVPSVAIAGYTNAGKSSLLNRLTQAGVLVENALFATLDPTVRRSRTPDGRRVHARRHRRVRAQPAAPAGRGVPLDARGGRAAPTSSCTSSTRRTPTPPRSSRRCAMSSARSARATCPRSWRSTRATSPTTTTVCCCAGSSRRGVFVSARTGEGIDELHRAHRRAAAAPEIEVDAARAVRPRRGHLAPARAAAGCCRPTTRRPARACTALVHPQRLAELQEFVTA